MDEKKITRKEFKEAIHKATEELMNDSSLKHGESKLLICMTGMTFASRMEEILFGKEKED